MGKRILSIFAEADRLAGLVGRMRLASVVQITSAEAGSIPDRPETVRRVEYALEQLRAELGKSAPESNTVQRGVVPAAPGDERTQLLRRHLSAYVDLMAQRSQMLDDSAATLRRVNEVASATLNVERVSVWLCDAPQTKISCADLFERGSGRHSSGTVLLAKDFAPYFRALRTERTIAAHDANTDPRTACFSTGYLEPLGITSLLDVPIWVNEQMIGVICHEHIGPKRLWDADEETFAYLASHFVALAFERERR
jgi:hypothetical protein